VTSRFASFLNLRAPLLSWVAAVAFFMETLDATVIVTALPSIARDFAAAVFLPATAWVADRLGPRNVFAGAIVAFVLSSIACAASTNLEMFVIARFVQGAAAAMMSPIGRLIVLRTTPKDRMIEAIGVITWPGLVGPVVGPTLGGFLTQYASWHWIFLINIPLGIVGFALVMKFMPNDRAAKQNPFDWTSFALTGLALTALLYGLNRIGGEAGQAVLPIGLIAVGLALGYVAVRRMLTVENPLLRIDTLMAPSLFIATITSGGLTRVITTTIPFLAPLFFQIGFKLDPFAAGLSVMPYFLGNLMMKFATTPILRGAGFWQVLVVTAVINAVAMAGFALMPAPTEAPIRWMLAILLFAAGLSRSMGLTALTTLAFADVPTERMADANVLSSACFQLAQALGIATAALILRFSVSVRGAVEIGAADFRVAIGILAALFLVTAFGFSRMHRDIGGDLVRAK
jgi:MFS family permease